MRVQETKWNVQACDEEGCWTVYQNVGDSEDRIIGGIESESFAHLIAAAPELLEMVRNLVGLASVRGRLDDYKALLTDAKKLIAKAEGRS